MEKHPQYSLDANLWVILPVTCYIYIGFWKLFSCLDLLSRCRLFFRCSQCRNPLLREFFFGGGRERISFSKSKIVSDPNWPAVWGGLKQPVIIVIGNWIPNRWELISGLSMRFWFQQLPACPFTAFRCPLWETLFCMFRGKIGNPVLRPS